MTTTTIEQIIVRARDMKPAAQAAFIGRYDMKELAEIHGRLVGQAKPRTPRPVLERRILAALAEPAPKAKEAPPEEERIEESNARAEAFAGNELPRDAEGHAYDEEVAPTGEGAAAAPDAAATPADANVGATSPARERDPRLPAIGTVIEKCDRRGAVRASCRVEAEGIVYNGAIYKSLSGAAIAAAKDLGLASKTADGFAFWGLKKRGRPAIDAASALDRAWQRYQGQARAAAGGATPELAAKVRELLTNHANTLLAIAGQVAQ